MHQNLSLSVLIPTYGRPDALECLLAGLARQTLAPERFEVIVVDDGSPEPISLDASEFPFGLTLLRQQQAGPGAARNHGLERCAAPLVLILNDDAVPADDLLERHLAAHATAPERTAVLGSFRFGPQARRSAFVRLLDESDLLFSFSRLRDGEFHDWQFFWTCNLSLPVSALRDIGGFDAKLFPEAIVEDVELGYRLSQRGWRVLYADDCRCDHEHTLTPEAFLRRAERLGFYLTRMQAKHRNPEFLYCKTDRDVQKMQEDAIDHFELDRVALHKLRLALEQFDREYEGRQIPVKISQHAIRLIFNVGFGAFAAGVHREVTGADALAVAEQGAPSGELTSVVIISCDQLAYTRRCVEALRKAMDERYPVELIVVDNGSTDGSAEWLGDQDDLTLICNPSNLGAPHARNQATVVARGAWIAYLDNDVFVPPGWLERALYHGAVDPRVGAIALVANRASKHQQVPYDGTGEASSIAAFAKQRYAEYARRGMSTDLFTSLGVLLRRAVIDQIGGFDERFSPWGFEDDDLALRVRFAGWRNRVALDTFVYHAPYPDEAKHERHSAHLRTNWERFVEKWGRPGSVPKMFDYAALDLSRDREVDPALLVVELPGAAEEPWPLGTASPLRVLAWPRYDCDDDLRRLAETYADTLLATEGVCLCLRYDPQEDGPVDAALTRVEAGLGSVVREGRVLEVLLVDDALKPEDLARLGRAVTCVLDLTGGEEPARAEFMQALNTVVITDADELGHRLAEGSPASRKLAAAR